MKGEVETEYFFKPEATDVVKGEETELKFYCPVSHLMLSKFSKI